MNSKFLYSEFKPFCERSGIEIHKDDLRYLENLLPRIPVDRQRYVLKDYVSIWKTEQDQNQGRRKANRYIREVIDEKWPTN